MEQNLSDNQRRTICRVLFLLLCALPTLATVYFATHQRTAKDWAQILQAELGVDTSIGVVETPRPGEMVFHDVQLKDVTGEVIFVSLKAKVTLGNINEIEFQNPIQINRKGLNGFLKEASARLVKSRADFKPWSVKFQDVQIVDGPDPSFQNQGFYLQDVHVAGRDGQNGIHITASAYGLGAIDFSRAPYGSKYEGQFEIKINTNENAVPCWLAADWFPELKQLGTQAHFKGGAAINSRGGSMYSSLSGSFVGVDLSRMPGINFGYADTSQSIYVQDLQLEDTVWRNGEAMLVLDGYRKVNLKDFILQPAEPVDAPLGGIIRRALREVSSSSAIH